MATITVAENLPPVAIANADKVGGVAPLTVQFDGSKSYDPEGKPLSWYFWTFGDGSAGVSAVSPTHVFTNPGVFVVILNVTDEKGAGSSDTVVITVTSPVNNPPIASPVVSTNSGHAPLAVTFAANASDPDGDAISYAWAFGDGGTSTLANPAHTYLRSGTYVAWLTVSDGRLSSSYSLTITVDSALLFSVASASAKSNKKDVGKVDVVADFSTGLPSADTLIAMHFDGIELFALPFSAFVADGAQAYVYQHQSMVVRLDFGAAQIVVHTAQMSLVGLDNSNGVDVELMVGSEVAVENIVMTPAPGNKLEYNRAQ